MTLQAAQQYIAQLAFPLSFDHLEHIIIWVYKKNYIVTVKERGRGGEVNFQMQTN